MSDQFSGTIMRRVLIRSGDLTSDAGSSSDPTIDLDSSRPRLFSRPVPIPSGGIITSTCWAPASGIRSLGRTIGRLILTRSYEQPDRVLLDIRGSGKSGQGAVLLYVHVLAGDAREAGSASVNLGADHSLRFNLLTDNSAGDTTFTLEDATQATVGVEYYFRVTANRVTINVAGGSQDRLLIRPDNRRGRRRLVNSITSNGPGETVVVACRRENQWVVENPSPGFRS